MPRPKMEVLSLEEKLALAVKALEFYASQNSWKPSDAYHTHATITDIDLKYVPGAKTSDMYGGKLAIDTLEKINFEKQN